MSGKLVARGTGRDQYLLKAKSMSDQLLLLKLPVQKKEDEKAEIIDVLLKSE